MCALCVGDEFLSSDIERTGGEGTCSYCELNGPSVSIAEIALRVDTALSQHFYLFDSDDEPADATQEPTGDTAGPSSQGLPLLEVIKSIAGINQPAAVDVLKVLADRRRDFIDDDPDVFEPPIDASTLCLRRKLDHGGYDTANWESVEESIQAGPRFFNRMAEDILSSMFREIEGHKSALGRPVIVEVGPGTDIPVLYRARPFQDETLLREAMKRPDRHVGPPPPAKRAAGRMNAAGIAVFYGATDAELALREVQPPVGSKVLIGHFAVLRPLRLLDIEALKKAEAGVDNVFDPEYLDRLERAAFLRGLSDRMARPVMPEDCDRDYLLTQAIADFLSVAVQPPLDGIFYPSVQDGFPRRSFRLLGQPARRSNVVLFQRAARVQPLELPDDAMIEVTDDDVFSMLGFAIGSKRLSDAPGLRYTISESVSATGTLPEPSDAPLRCTTLEVRYIRAISFDTQDSVVSRIRL